MPLLISTGRYNHGVAITKSDTVNIYPISTSPEATPGLTDAIQVGETGVIVVVWQDGSTTAMTVAAGDILPIAIKRINATNTAGTLFVALRTI